MLRLLTPGNQTISAMQAAVEETGAREESVEAVCSFVSSVEQLLTHGADAGTPTAESRNALDESAARSLLSYASAIINRCSLTSGSLFTALRESLLRQVVSVLDACCA